MRMSCDKYARLDGCATPIYVLLISYNFSLLYVY